MSKYFIDLGHRKVRVTKEVHWAYMQPIQERDEARAENAKLETQLAEARELLSVAWFPFDDLRNRRDAWLKENEQSKEAHGS